MRRSIRRALWAGVAATVAVAVVPITAALGAGSLTTSFAATSDWGSGHEVRVTVTNGTDAPVATWRVEFDLPAGTTISSSWDADVTRSGNRYVAVQKSWAGALAPGASATWGYIGSGGYRAPANCTVNGGACGGGGTPNPTPTTPRPTVSPTPTPTTPPPTTTPPPNPGAQKVVGYFAQWGVYQRAYHVKNIHTSGSAAKLTHILYAFGNTTGGRCTIGDSYADYDRAYSAAESVDGVADTWDAGALRGSFNQLRKLKRMYPHLKVIWSFGGWTWSGGFTQAAQNPAAFAESCYNLVEDPRWADVFDGIDIDWEYPNACGLTCDASGPNSFKNLISALRGRFGSSNLVTAAITADGSNGGKIDAADYAGAINNLNWLMPMTYDYFGAFAAQGPTAPHSPLTSYAGIPQQGFWSDAAIQKLKSKGVPASKLLLGIGFYGRGWTGVTQATPGGTATGAAPGTYEAGIEDYKVLKNTCPATGTIAGTAYAKCGSNWWSYDTPATIGGKMSYAKGQGLGGAFFWELSGDTSNGELITAVANGLR
ncbi:glycosyl hydrolase family 18 protein [Plantactinospora sp. KLBMP9567]|uniref:glycosyl hydrolase family 18 protein n=1 Tax=Plantactinospora sp. KLBMP9567 TaxID=3085900 RepID=UPI0029824438|nr:glycosyl hydrolase family 18 protein [Plantactinospora sp. KLBMP9567]MDW5323006.1 glycosyl hydrolase family 18 protein [Plantactinospora sp. KLBMP9567]